MNDETNAYGAYPPAYPPPPPPVPSPPPAPRRRRLALTVTAALVAVAAAAGAGYALLGPGFGGDGKPAAAPWTPPSPTATKDFGARSGGSHYGSLGKLLLPMPDGYGPGPDWKQFGNDVVLDGTHAKDLVFGDTGTKLSARGRARLDAAIASLHIQGAGLRTYAPSSGDYVIAMEIVQMRNKAAARSETEYTAALAEALGNFRKGPRIAGHARAVCYLPPRDKGERLDLMMCRATEGDLLVTMSASGTVPLHTKEAADLLSKQLDRIQDPGEAV